jgi:hypothetical protein
MGEPSRIMGHPVLGKMDLGQSSRAERPASSHGRRRCRPHGRVTSFCLICPLEWCRAMSGPLTADQCDGLSKPECAKRQTILDNLDSCFAVQKRKVTADLGAPCRPACTRLGSDQQPRRGGELRQPNLRTGEVSCLPAATYDDGPRAC